MSPHGLRPHDEGWARRAAAFEADVGRDPRAVADRLRVADRLDPDECARLVAGMEPMEEVIRSSGQYGPRVPVPDDADAQTRLLGFIGRDPDWKP